MPRLDETRHGPAAERCSDLPYSGAGRPCGYLTADELADLTGLGTPRLLTTTPGCVFLFDRPPDAPTRGVDHGVLIATYGPAGKG